MEGTQGVLRLSSEVQCEVLAYTNTCVMGGGDGWWYGRPVDLERSHLASTAYARPMRA